MEGLEPTLHPYGNGEPLKVKVKLERLSEVRPHGALETTLGIQGLIPRALESRNDTLRVVLERQHSDYLPEDGLDGKRQEAGRQGRALNHS